MVQDIIFEYFCRPVLDPTVQGYNILNTGVYALILFGVVWLWLWPFLKKEKVKFNFGFMLALLPYIIFGSALRVINDLGFFEKTCSPFDIGFYTFTPGIWFLTAGIAIACLYASRKIAGNDEKKFEQIFAISGLGFALPVLAFELTVFQAAIGLAQIIALVFALVLAAKIITEHFRKNFFGDKMNLFVLAGQTLDGSATLVATSFYRCGEQHPFSEVILGVNPWLFVGVKIVLALVIIHTLDSDIKDENTRGFLKIVVAILGFAPGLRDALTVAVGTCL